MTDVVRYERDQAVALITLNRPETLNAWTLEMGAAYLECLDAAATDTSVRVVVITGAGDGFCSGADMSLLKDLMGGVRPPPNTVRDDIDIEPAVPKPVIAAINGPCVGLGLARALYCDVRFMARDTSLSTAFARRGLPAEDGLAWLLPRIVGWSRALDLMLSGRSVAADEAAEIGLVNHVVDDALVAAMDYAHDVARECSPASLRDIKSQIWGDETLSLREANAHADRLLLASFTRADLAEGVMAHLDKRSPNFPPLP